jgi:hypothetical protein
MSRLVKREKTRAESYGTRNVYTCEDCGGIIVTQDIEDGVTPFGIACRATDGCQGLMQSGAYNRSSLSAIPIRPHFVWRKPTPEEYAASSKAMQDHFDHGGLEMYPLPPVPEHAITLPRRKPQ